MAFLSSPATTHQRMEDGIPALPSVRGKGDADRRANQIVLAAMLVCAAFAGVVAVSTTGQRAVHIKGGLEDDTPWKAHTAPFQKRGAPAWAEKVATFFDNFDSPDLASDVALHQTIYDDASVMHWPWQVSPMTATGVEEIMHAHAGFFQMYPDLKGEVKDYTVSGDSITLDCVFTATDVTGGKVPAKFAFIGTVNKKGKITEGTWFGDFTYVFSAGGAFDPMKLPHAKTGPCAALAAKWESSFEANDFSPDSPFWKMFVTTTPGEFCMNLNCIPMGTMVDQFSHLRFGESVIVTAMTDPMSTVDVAGTDTCEFKFSHDWKSGLDESAGNIRCQGTWDMDGDMIKEMEMTCAGSDEMLAAAAAAVSALPAKVNKCEVSAKAFQAGFDANDFSKDGPMWSSFDVTTEGSTACINGQCMPVSVLVDNFAALPFGTKIIPSEPSWEEKPLASGDCTVHMHHGWKSTVDGSSGTIMCSGIVQVSEAGLLTGMDMTCNGMDKMVGAASAAMQA